MHAMSRQATKRGQVVSDDILELICVRAAQEDRYAAYALAFTCRKVCRWTAKARWRTVVIRSAKQLLSFWKAIYAVPDEVFEAFRARVESLLTSSSSHQVTDAHLSSIKRFASTLSLARNRLCKGLSYPADGKPHKHVRHLYIDLSSSASHNHISSSANETRSVVKGCLDFMAFNIFSQTDILADPRSLLNRWACNQDQGALDVLSLGIDETEALNWGALSGIKIRELTLVLRKDYSGDLHIDMTPTVERLHIIGMDPTAELTGVEPPWTLLKSLTAPVIKEGLSGLPTLTHRRLAYLRFDTRRFSLKPAEITAKRLRPLLQECTVAPRPSSFSDEADARPVASTFQFNGPRHAAPARGAGSYLPNQQFSRLLPVARLAGRHDETTATYLHSIGVGQLKLLQFAWEPIASPIRDLVAPWYKREASGDGLQHALAIDRCKPVDLDARLIDQTGGWPREVRGAWTESAERKSNMGSFAVELRDSIGTLFGWHAPEIEAAGKFCSRFDRMTDKEKQEVPANTAFSADGTGLMVEAAQAGITQADEDDLRALALLVKANVPAWRTGHPEWDDDDLDFLRFGIRAPRSLVHLGGQAAFTSLDRLKMFEDRAYGGQGAWP